MSPTVRHDCVTRELDVVRTTTTPRAAIVYSSVLVGCALALTATLVVGGSGLPTPGALLLLAIPLALCANRFLFFPNEAAVTADAAVIFAAMVVFRDDAPWVGPLVIALLVGVLDAKHWSERSFVRMAYNSGSTALVAASSLAAYTLVSPATAEWWPAALSAVATYVVVESLLGVGLFVLLGERVHDAVRHQVPLNTIVVPLALVGGLAGVAALDVGWWCALVVLAPMAAVPELAFVVLPRRRARLRESSCLAVAATLLLVAVTRPEPARTLIALAAVAILTGIDGRPARSFPVPLLGVVAVTAALVVPAADTRVAALAAVPATAIAVSWWCGSTPRTRWSGLLWCVPIAAAAYLAARLWHESGRAGPVVFVAAMTVALVAVAAWGAPPWGSRMLGSWSYRHLTRHRRSILVTWSAAAVVLAGVALAVGGTHPVAVLVAGVCAQVDLAIALVATRQWRFAPRRRARDATVIVAASIGSTAVMASRPSVAVLVVAVALTVVLASYVAWPLTLGGETRDHVDQEHAP